MGKFQHTCTEAGEVASHYAAEHIFQLVAFHSFVTGQCRLVKLEGDILEFGIESF